MLKDTFNKVVSTLKGSQKLSNIEQQIDKLFNKSSVVPDFKRNWVELIRAVSQQDSSEILKNLTGSLLQQSLYPDANRIKRYDLMRGIARKIPVVGKAVRLMTANILAPDDITRPTLLVRNDDAISSEDVAVVKNDFEQIIKTLKIDKQVRTIIHDTLLYGDVFVEITPLKLDEFMRQNAKPIYDNFEFDLKVNGYTEKPSILLEFTDLSELNTIGILEQQLKSDYSFYNYLHEVVYSNDDVDLNDILVKVHDPRNVVILQAHDILIGYLVFRAGQLKPGNFAFRNYFNDKANQNIFNNVADALLQRIEAKIISILQDKHNDIEIPDDLHTVLYKLLTDARSRMRNLTVKFVPPELMQHFKYPSTEFKPYGEPYLMDLQFILSLLLTRIISSTIYKVARAGKHLVFYVEASNARDAAARIQRIKEQTKRLKVTSSDLMSVETIPSLISTFDDFYIPQIDGKRLVDIDTLDFSDAAKDRDDMDNVILKQVLTGIDIPPPFLGIEENVNAKATLVQESMVFARSVVDLQAIFSDQITELVHKIYMVTHKQASPYMNDVYIGFSPPISAISESFSNMYTQIGTIRDTLKSFGVPDDYIAKRFLPDIDWDEIKLQKLQNEASSKKEENEEQVEQPEFESPVGGEEEVPEVGV